MNTNDVKSMISEFSEPGSFCSFINQHLVDKYVEIYTGNEYDTVSVEQQSFNNPAVFCGKILGTAGYFIVLDCFSKTADSIQSGNLLFINIDSIKSLKLLNDYKSMKSMFIKSGSKKYGKVNN